MPKNRVQIDPNTLIAAKKGDMGAFEEIVTAWERPIYSFIYRMVNQKADAEDLAQETFVTLHRYIDRYDPEKNFQAWLFTIASRTVYKFLRVRQRRKELFIIDDPDTFYEPAAKKSEYHRIDHKLDIEQALQKIRQDYRMVILLYYWQEYSYNEIADTLEIPLNTVKTFLRRGKQELRRAMG